MVVISFPHAVLDGRIDSSCRAKLATPVTDLEPLFLGRWSCITRLRPIVETATRPERSERGPLCGLTLTRSIGRSLGLLRDPGRAVQVELEDTRNHHDGLRLISIFKKGEPERCCTVNK